MTVTVYVNDECPKLPDGRTRHIYEKVNGVFVCSHCGRESNPAQRWEKP